MTYTLLKFSQPAGAFFLTTMSALDVVRIARANPRKFDVATLNTMGGIQRPPSENRIARIAEYCRTSDSAFPTAVILAVREDNYDLSVDETSISFKGEPPFADV